jgi:hypothetical protein
MATSKISATAQRAHPDEPWLWRKDWASGRYTSRDCAAVWITWLFTLVFGAASTLLVPEFEKLSRDAPETIALLAFPIVAAGMLFWALFATVRWVRFRSVELELETRPGVVGGKVGGRVHLGRPAAAGTSYIVVLTCEEMHKRKRPNSRNGPIRSVLFQEKLTVHPVNVGQGPTGAVVPFAFTVPFELPASTHGYLGAQKIAWSVAIGTGLSGSELIARYDVPVFETDESQADITGQLREGIEPSLETAYDAPLEGDPGVAIHNFADGTFEISFPSGRNKPFLLSLSGFTLFWSCMLAFMLTRMDGTMKFAAFPFVIAGIVLWILTPALWLHKTTLTVRNRELTIRDSALGRTLTRVIPGDDVASISVERWNSIGREALWSLVVQHKSAHQDTAVTCIRSKANAKRFATMLWTALQE